MEPELKDSTHTAPNAIIDSQELKTSEKSLTTGQNLPTPTDTPRKPILIQEMMKEIDNQVRHLLAKKQVSTSTVPNQNIASEVRERLARQILGKAIEQISAMGFVMSVSHKGDGETYIDNDGNFSMLELGSPSTALSALRSAEQILETLSATAIQGIDIGSVWEAVFENSIAGTQDGFESDGTASGEHQTLLERIEMIITMQISIEESYQNQIQGEGDEIQDEIKTENKNDCDNN